MWPFPWNCMMQVILYWHLKMWPLQWNYMMCQHHIGLLLEAVLKDKATHCWHIRGSDLRVKVKLPCFLGFLLLMWQFFCVVFQSLELWNMAENKMMTRMGEPISALALSDTAGLVASASRDNLVKIWKWIYSPFVSVGMVSQSYIYVFVYTHQELVFSSFFKV